MSLDRSVFVKYAAAGVVALGAMLAAVSANAGVNWSVDVAVPGVVVTGPGPGYYEPAPAYAPPAPVYYQPAPPAYYRAPPEVYYEREEGPRFHRRYWDHDRRDHRREWEHRRHEERRDRRDRD